MTHVELVETVSWWMHGAPKGRVRRTLSLLVSVILDEVREGRSVHIPGFGTFSPGTRKAPELVRALQRSGARLKPNVVKPGGGR